MIVVRTINELASVLGPGVETGLVTTMGAFHEGHLTLMRSAATECERSVVSLFVNPSQFAPGEDLSTYPSQEATDIELAGSAGVDILFAPSVEEMYKDNVTWVEVNELTDNYEGKARPSHFRGVATVVLKLFNLISPQRAYFGLKDLQQCAVVRRMVADLNLKIDLRFLETVREEDGLAMSSRNRYLLPAERALAARINGALGVVAQQVKSGVSLDEALDLGRAHLEEVGIKPDYLESVDWHSMTATKILRDDSRVIVAAKVGQVRLLDNIPLVTH
ncbi:MAG: pantoate--beta-alanine ligase [Chthonomonadaceae bacterium]|nr:pantoate--beta-alanine ligase [Chthonomonadaceae bacterium]